MFWNKRKIIGYKIVEEPTKTLLEDEVRKLIKEGWELYGPASKGIQYQYMQTLVMYL